MFEWLNTNSSAIQALATVVLVIVTVVYVVLTHRLANAAKRQAAAAAAQAHAAAEQARLAREQYERSVSAEQAESASTIEYHRTQLRNAVRTILAKLENHRPHTIDRHIQGWTEDYPPLLEDYEVDELERLGDIDPDVQRKQAVLSTATLLQRSEAAAFAVSAHQSVRQGGRKKVG